MTKKKKPEPNPIEEAIGDRANPPAKLTFEELQKVAKDVKKAVVKGTILVPLNPSVIPDEPSPQEMLSLEELNRQTEERLQDQYPEEETPPKTIKDVLAETIPTPVSKLDRLPVTKNSSPESPPQEIEPKKWTCQECGEIVVDWTSHICEPSKYPEKRKPSAEQLAHLSVEKTQPAEDVELTNLRKYILEDGFVLATVAFHIVSLCAQPMTTPSTTTWDFKDRASIPDMVLALLNQPGYLEGIWPSLRIVMGSNKGNAAWTAGIATTIAFFDVIRTLPAIEELKNEEKS